MSQLLYFCKPNCKALWHHYPEVSLLCVYPNKNVLSCFFLIEYGLCSVPFENKLYLVGGQTTIAECYDPEQNEWREIAPMMERRMECGAVIMNGCIYVTGGYSYSKGTYLQSIEKYDPDLNKWEIVGNLPSAMRSHGCVCVYNVWSSPKKWPSSHCFMG